MQKQYLTCRERPRQSHPVMLDRWRKDWEGSWGAFCFRCECSWVPC
jgi:hypothetical protein